MIENNPTRYIDLKPYQPYGIPIIKLMTSIVLISLLATAFYEFVL